MKNLFKKAATFSVIYSRRRGHIRNIREKNRFLQKQGIYKKFPVKEVSPLVNSFPFSHSSDRLWLDFFYSVYGEPVDTFIPLTTYTLFIEPALNLFPLLRAIKEKNAYNKIFPEIKTPATILRRINGFYYDGGYNLVDINDSWLDRQIVAFPGILIKPSLRSGSGRSVRMFTQSGGKHYSGTTLLDSAFLQKYGTDFILQAKVNQHPYFRQFSPDSGNTVRVLTYRSVKDDTVHILHTLLRIGKQGSFMDHDNLGGVAINIRDEIHLQDHAIDINGIKHTKFNDILFQNAGPIPFIEKVHSIARTIAGNIFYGRLLAMDFIVDDRENVLLIEINCQGNGVSQYQMNNGSLFGQFTSEILDHSKEKKIENLYFSQY